MDAGQIERTLYMETSFARSPTERKDQILSIMDSLMKR